MTQLPEPIYQSAHATLYCGDCRDIMPLLKGCDACVTDPPYGINFSYGARQTSGKISAKYWVNAGKKIKGDNKPFDPAPILAMFCAKSRSLPVAIFGADHFSSRLPDGTWYCWDKSCGMGPAIQYTDAEYIWSNRRNARRIFRHLWLGVLRAGEDYSSPTTRKLHMSQKPVELMMWLIETIRIGVGKTILDPYMGSGSTGVAAIRTGRKFIGIEIDPEHAATAAWRIEETERKFL
ncbi:MAG: DNA-methyltransferase [Saccharofermentanales bacterium]